MMNANNMDNFMNMIIFFAGFFMIYAGLKLRIKGEVPSGFISRNINWDKARDKEGYIKVMAPVNVAAGIVMIIFGLVISYVEKIESTGYMAESIVILVAFVMCLIYAIIAMKMQNKYLK